jgi:hypothetical protein
MGDFAINWQAGAHGRFVKQINLLDGSMTHMRFCWVKKQEPKNLPVSISFSFREAHRRFFT